MNDRPLPDEAMPEGLDLLARISLQNEETLRHLVQFLDFSEGLTIGFVKCNVPSQKRRLVADLKAMIAPLFIRLVEIELQQPISDLREIIMERLASSAADEGKIAVFVYGLEHSLPSNAPLPPLLARLNFTRELFRRDVPHPLVLWLPDYALTMLARGAPDFWAWRSGVYEFAPERELAQREYERATALGELEVDNISLAQKRERIRLLRNLLDDYEELGEGRREKESMARILWELADVYYRLGEYDEACQFYHRSVEMAEELGNRHGASYALHRMGRIARIRGDYREAERLYRHSLEKFEELGDRQNAAWTFRRLGMLARERGDYTEAEQLFHRSLETFEELGDQRGAAWTLNHWGVLAHTRGDYEEAERLCKRSLETFEELGDRRGVAWTLHKLGRIAHLQGNYAEVEQLYKRSLEIFEDLGDRHGVARTLHYLGRLAHDRGDYEGAERLYRHSLRRFEELGDRYSIAHTKEQLALLEEGRGNLEAACKLMAEAAEAFKEMGLVRDWERAQAQFRRLEEIAEGTESLKR